MDKSKFLKYCKFFTGEEKSPKDFNGDFKAFFYWEAEEAFIRYLGTKEEQQCNSFYKMQFPDDKDRSLPLSLKASLFAVLCHGSDLLPSENAKRFPEFLADYVGWT